MRDLFSRPSEGISFLNAAYMTPLPRRAAAAGHAALDVRADKWWTVTPADFFGASEQVRATLAGLWGAPSANIALAPSVSYGVEVAVRNLPLSSGQEIVLPFDDFPSNVYPWREAARRAGAAIRTVARPADFDWTRDVLAAIGPRTAVVSVPYSDWSDGTLFDLRAIGARCREVGAGFVVDVSQSFGAAPIRVRDFDPDFLVSVGYKWQLGPYGIAYLYVADRWLGGAPIENGWLNRARSEDFARLVEYQDEYQAGARRFDVGERSQFQLAPVALESMRVLAELGAGPIAASIGALFDPLYEGLAARGFDLPARERLSRHMLGARRAGVLDMSPLAGALRERGVFVSARGTALRVSPHVYNGPEDVAAFFGALDGVL